MADSSAQENIDFWAAMRAEKWHVTINPAGGSVHVSPGKGLLGVENWAWWHWRRMYPRTEKQLAKAVAACQRWCDKENAKEAKAQALAERWEEVIDRNPEPMEG